MYRAKGYSEEDIVKAKKRKQLSEDVNVCQLIIKTKAWNFGENHIHTYTKWTLSATLPLIAHHQYTNTSHFIPSLFSSRTDVSCTYTDTYLRLAMALEALTRRKEAIAALERGYAKSKARNTTLALALAKLLFKGKPQILLSPLSPCPSHFSSSCHNCTLSLSAALFVVHTCMPSLVLSI
jgi:hypothetical protein